MSDDKTKADGRDRSRVSASDDYEVQDFAQKHGITTEQARELIERHGNDREELERAASRVGT